MSNITVNYTLTNPEILVLEALWVLDKNKPQYCDLHAPIHLVWDTIPASAKAIHELWFRDMPMYLKALRTVGLAIMTSEGPGFSITTAGAHILGLIPREYRLGLRYA